MMKKVERDGKIAVIYSPGYGAGWFTWTGLEDILFDPVIVEMIETEKDADSIVEYCKKTYGEDHYFFGVMDDLAIEWVDKGTEFIVHEYDGSERIMFKSDFNWITA